MLDCGRRQLTKQRVIAQEGELVRSARCRTLDAKNGHPVISRKRAGNLSAVTEAGPLVIVYPIPMVSVRLCRDSVRSEEVAPRCRAVLECRFAPVPAR